MQPRDQAVLVRFSLEARSRWDFLQDCTYTLPPRPAEAPPTQFSLETTGEMPRLFGMSAVTGGASNTLTAGGQSPVKETMEHLCWDFGKKRQQAATWLMQPRDPAVLTFDQNG